MKALSIRQPWAWLIANGYKDIENRDWPTHFRGEIYIHAGKTCTKAEYEDAVDTAKRINPDIEIPPLKELERGGIVGTCTITGCTDRTGFTDRLQSPWFFGKFGFAIDNAKPMAMVPYKGKLGFFDVELDDYCGYIFLRSRSVNIPIPYPRATAAVKTSEFN